MKKRKFVSIIALILFIFSSGCEDLNDPGEVKIKNSFFYNVQVYDTLQKAYVYRTTDMSGRQDHRAADPFSHLFNINAEVILTDLTEGKTILFKLSQDTLKNTYLLNPYKPCFTNRGPFYSKPASVFNLKVFAGGDIITGEVTAPGDFEILSPLEGEVIKGYKNLKDYVFRWRSSEAAKVYQSRIFIKIKDDFMQGSYWAEAETMDTVNSFMSWLNTNAVESGQYILRIAAFDDNYYQHYYNKKVSAGLNGAYGCFSSSVVKEVRFIYIKE